MSRPKARDLATIPLTYNLACSEGHKHWSPTADNFVGQECLAAVARNGLVKCRERLVPIKVRS